MAQTGAEIHSHRRLAKISNRLELYLDIKLLSTEPSKQGFSQARSIHDKLMTFF